MRITPFEDNKFVFAKLTIPEWGFNLLMIIAIPSFLNSVSELMFGRGAAWLYAVSAFFVVIADVILIYIKGKETNFISVWFTNKLIPNKIEGSFPNRIPITKIKDDENLLFSKKDP